MASFHEGQSKDKNFLKLDAHGKGTGKEAGSEEGKKAGLLCFGNITFEDFVFN